MEENMEVVINVPDIARDYYIVPDDYQWEPEGEAIPIEDGDYMDSGKPKDSSSGFNKFRYTQQLYRSSSVVQKQCTLPYGLTASDFPPDFDMDKLSSMANLLNHSLSKGTILNYTTVIKRFREFVVKAGHSFSEFSSQMLEDWILHLEKLNVAFSFWGKIKPALEHLEMMLGREQTVITKRINLCLTGGKRFSAKSKPVTRKAVPIPPEVLRLGIDTVVNAFGSNISQIKGDLFRSLYKEILKLKCVGRFGDYAKLKAKHFTDLGDCIQIHFPSAKNDQYHMGNDNIISDEDSAYSFVKLTRTYFKRFGLQFGNSGTSDENFINFQVRAVKQSDGSVTQLADGRRSLSRSQSFDDSKKLFKFLGYDGSYSEKSAKMTGVKLAFEAKGTPEQIRDLGRWKTTDMPLHYLEQSKEYNKKFQIW